MPPIWAVVWGCPGARLAGLRIGIPARSEACDPAEFQLADDDGPQPESLHVDGQVLDEVQAGAPRRQHLPQQRIVGQASTIPNT